MATKQNLAFIAIATLCTVGAAPARADVTLTIIKQYTEIGNASAKQMPKGGKAMMDAMESYMPELRFVNGKPCVETVYIHGQFERHDSEAETRIVDTLTGDTTVIDRHDSTYQIYPKALGYTHHPTDPARTIDITPTSVSGQQVVAGHETQHYIYRAIVTRPAMFKRPAGKETDTTEVWAAPDLETSNPLQHADLMGFATVDRFHSVPGMILRVRMTDSTGVTDVIVDTVSTKSIPASYFLPPPGYRKAAVSRADVSTVSTGVDDSGTESSATHPAPGVKPAPETKPADSDLSDAMLHDNLEDVKAAVAAGANVNAIDDGTPVVSNAVAFEDIAIVEFLLDHGANPNVLGDSSNDLPLVFAARKGNTEIARVLIEHGANVNPGSLGAPLVVAADSRNVDIVRLLLDHNADINQQNERGDTAIGVASGEDNVAIVQLLLDHKPSLNIADTQYGDTPLTKAARHGRSEIVKLLLAHGADVNLLNANKESALDVANDGFHPVTLKILQDAAKK